MIDHSLGTPTTKIILLFVRSSGSDKVLRWNLYLQNFDITNVFIKGEDNEVSDSFSRLCAVSDSTEYLTMLEEYEIAPAPEQYLNLLHERSPSDEELALLVLYPKTSMGSRAPT